MTRSPHRVIINLQFAFEPEIYNIGHNLKNLNGRMGIGSAFQIAKNLLREFIESEVLGTGYYWEYVGWIPAVLRGGSDWFSLIVEQ